MSIRTNHEFGERKSQGHNSVNASDSEGQLLAVRILIVVINEQIMFKYRESAIHKGKTTRLSPYGDFSSERVDRVWLRWQDQQQQ
jgi:hypothetical protein